MLRFQPTSINKLIICIQSLPKEIQTIGTVIRCIVCSCVYARARVCICVCASERASVCCVCEFVFVVSVFC